MEEPKTWVWEGYYKPQHLKDVILPQEFRNFFIKILEMGASMNLILASSTPGSGKSTTALALANDLGADVLFINASDENGINTIRDKVTGFASSMSFTGKPKIVIFDEADGMTPQGQETLRNYIDTYQSNCRFIFTCNYLAKIIPALKEEGGRTMLFEYDMKKPEYKEELTAQIFKRMTGILKHEKIEFDPEAVTGLIEQHFPSIRSITTILQKYSMMHGFIDKNILNYAKIGEEFIKMVKLKKLGAIRKYISDNGISHSEVFSYLMNYVVPELGNKGDAILNIAEYEYRSNISSDPSIQVAACLVELFQCV